jgi:lipopolysaccharide transport system ATP-binding protein
MKESVTVEHLSKKYELGALKHETQLRDLLVKVLRAPWRERAAKEVLWALRDISFSIREGEVVGIIGRNGAGKSTLLKILSKITHPTSGKIHTRGRVASLLEVGTGFHEELTGRENIFLNGSILGMKKREVESKLEAIVEFSGVQRFIDTPIKRYSSGMRLRLGFAVAAHLEPDVLIVDEVLAVGDAGFQKKCISAMEDLRGGGRTVLFVSHNMAAVENLCSRGIWIDNGQLRTDGPAHEVIETYMATFSNADSVSSDLTEVSGRRGSGEVRYTKVEFLSTEGGLQTVTRSGRSVVIRMYYKAEQPVPLASLGFRLSTELGTLITETSTAHHGINILQLPAGDGYADLEIKFLNLLPGRYYFTLAVTGGVNNHLYDWVENAVHLDVDAANIYNSAMVIDSRHGVVYFPQTWHLDGINTEYLTQRVAAQA